MTTRAPASGASAAPADAGPDPTAPIGTGAPPAGEPPVAAPRGFSDLTLAVATAAVTLPIFWMGYGTDIDVTDVLRTASGIWDGDYRPSRTPGVPVYEAIAALLDPVGGHVLLNLASVAAGVAAVVGLARLVRAWGHANGDLIALAFLASPATLIAATSTGDFIWAAAFFVWAAIYHLRDRTLVAGVLFGLAIGTRLSSLLLIAAFLVADGWDPPRRRRCLRAGAVAAVVGALTYVPAWLAYDRTFRFLRTSSDDGWRGVANNLGRFAYKNYATFGGLFVVAMLIALPALIVALRRWGRDPMLRAGVGGFAVTEALFLVLPWKYNHLLPCLATLLLWLGASRRNTRPFLWFVIAALALNAVVTFRPLAPDKPAEARAGRWDPTVTAGLLVNDIACRLDAMDEPLAHLNGDAWPCTLKPMRGPTEDSTGGAGRTTGS
jgi:Glycosyltransferase family 87